MNDDPTKLYTLHTRAPYEEISELAVRIATKTGHKVEVSETPDGAVVIVPRRIWVPARWWAVFVVLALGPFALRLVVPDATAAQGFGLGWLSATLVLLTGRN